MAGYNGFVPDGSVYRSSDRAAHVEPTGFRKFKRDFRDGFTGMHLNNMFSREVVYKPGTVTLGILSRFGVAAGGAVCIGYAIHYLSHLK